MLMELVKVALLRMYFFQDGLFLAFFPELFSFSFSFSFSLFSDLLLALRLVLLLLGCLNFASRVAIVLFLSSKFLDCVEDGSVDFGGVRGSQRPSSLSSSSSSSSS